MAYESNKIAITRMINDNVIVPCGCKLWIDVEDNFSSHIYKSDVDSAMKVINSEIVYPSGIIAAKQSDLDEISRSG